MIEIYCIQSTKPPKTTPSVHILSGSNSIIGCKLSMNAADVSLDIIYIYKSKMVLTGVIFIMQITNAHPICSQLKEARWSSSLCSLFPKALSKRLSFGNYGIPSLLEFLPGGICSLYSNFIFSFISPLYITSARNKKKKEQKEVGPEHLLPQFKINQASLCVQKRIVCMDNTLKHMASILHCNI